MDHMIFAHCLRMKDYLSKNNHFVEMKDAAFDSGIVKFYHITLSATSGRTMNITPMKQGMNTFSLFGR